MTTPILHRWIEDWKSKLQEWSIDGSLASAARHALELDSKHPLLDTLVLQWANGDFSSLPPVTLLPASSMPGAAGAYAISTASIYLNQDWLETASDERVLSVLTEELGHHLDAILNRTDTAGDEGEHLWNLLTGKMTNEYVHDTDTASDGIVIRTKDGMLQAEASTGAWLITAGNTGFDYGQSLTSLSDGSLIFTGIATGSISIGDHSISASGKNNFIGSLDADGNLQWLKSLTRNASAEVTSITRTQDDNIIAAGSYYNQVLAGDSVDLRSTGLTDFFVAKFSSNGDLEWAISPGVDTEGTSPSYPSIKSTYTYVDKVSSSSDGKYLITGRYQGVIALGGALLPSTRNSSDFNVFAAQISSDGLVEWARGFEVPAGWDSEAASAILSDGNIVIASDFKGSSDIDGVTYTAASGTDRDIALIKLNEQGETVWVKHLRGLGDDLVSGLEATRDGNFIVAGQFKNEVIIDSDHQFKAALDNDLFIAKISTSGSVIWANQTGGAFQSPYRVLDIQGADSLSVLNDGSSYLAGRFYGTAELPENTLTAEGWDFFVAKINADGQFEWANKLGGTRLGHSQYGVAVHGLDANGAVLTAGFNPYINAAGTVADSVGDFDFFLTKIGNDGEWKPIYAANPVEEESAPTIRLASTLIPENSNPQEFGIKLSLGGITVQDQVVYSLDQSASHVNDNDDFMIIDDLLFIKSSPDFERQSSFSVDLVALMPDGSTVERTVTIFIQDVLEEPSDLLTERDFRPVQPQRSSSQFNSYSSFAAILKDGSVYTWGSDLFWGRDEVSYTPLEADKKVVEIFSNPSAYAAILESGELIAWGKNEANAAGSQIEITPENSLKDVVTAASTQGAFAALHSDGRVTTWGTPMYGGDSSSVDLSGSSDGSRAVRLFSNPGAFAAIMADGNVKTWGIGPTYQASFTGSYANGGGDSRMVDFDGPMNNLRVIDIVGNLKSFAALRSDGTVVTWGDGRYGGSLNSVDLDGPNDNLHVRSIHANFYSYAAILSDGSVKTWGGTVDGGIAADNQKKGGESDHIDFNGPLDDLAVVDIVSTESAFAALRTDGSVVTWGGDASGGSSDASELIDVKEIYATGRAFAAVHTDGSVTTWGSLHDGGYSGNVDFDGASDDLSVVDIVSTYSSFAALRSDGSVVSWGGSYSQPEDYKLLGLDIAQAANPVVNIYASGSSFAALMADGTIKTWGYGINPQRLAIDGRVLAVQTPFESSRLLEEASNDDTAPATPAPPDLVPASDSGRSDVDDLTNDTTPTFTGIAEPGSTINFLIDGVLHPANTAVTTADSVTGEWSYTIPAEHAATKRITSSLTVTATDSAGNTSGQSDPLVITIDLTPPVFLSGSFARSVEEDSGAGQVVFVAQASDTHAVQYALKTGNGDDADFFTIDASTGDVTLMINPDYQIQSSYAFTVVATDAAGNSSEKEVSFQVTTPKTPAQQIDAIVIGANIDPFDNGSRNWWIDQLEESFDSITYVSASDLAARDASELEQFEVAIIPSDQTTQEYLYLEAASENQLEAYVERGGVLSYGVAGWGWAGGKPPTSLSIGGSETSISANFQNNAYINQDSSFSRATTTKELYANVANHAALSINSGESGNPEILTHNQDDEATTVKYDIGNGHLIITGLTLESPNNPAEWRPFYDDYLRFLLGLAQGDNSQELDPQAVDIAISVQSAQAGKSIAIPIQLSDAAGVESLDLNLTYDPAIFSAPQAGSLITAGSLNPGAAFVVNDSPPGQLSLSWASTSPLSSGSGSIATLNLDVRPDASPGTTTPLDLVSASLNEGRITSELTDGTLSILPPSFQVTNLRHMPNGLALRLPEAPDLDRFNLYDGPEDAAVDQPDLSLTNAAGTAIALSAHWQPSSNELLLLAAEPLADGSYSLTIDSRSDGLVSASSGEWLDGNGDGTGGDAYAYTFSHTTPETSLAIADTARGAGQALSVNGRGTHDPVTGQPIAAATGLPIHLSTATPLSSFSGSLSFDSSLLLADALTAGADLPDDWNLSIDPSSTAGALLYSASGSTALSGTDLEILRFQATVAAAAAPPERGTTGNGLYGSTALINASLTSDQLTGQPIAIDPGLIALAYSGDTTGNGTLSSLDASRVQRVVVGLDSGFDAYDTINPVLIGDTTGNGGLSSLDASRIQQQVVGLPVDSFPALPSAA